jgi:hypothetical protein
MDDDDMFTLAAALFGAIIGCTLAVIVLMFLF